MKKIKTTAGKGQYKWDYQEFLYLVHILSQGRDFKEIMNVFIDLHTHKEISEIIRRLIIASMLLEGDSYEVIAEEVGTGSNTIAKINQRFYREKSVLGDLLKRGGSYRKYIKKNVDERDWLEKMFDRTIYTRSAGLFGKK